MTTDNATEARVVTSYGRSWQVRRADGDVVGARVKGRKLKPVCGDRVLIEPIDQEADFLIVDVLPRRNELARPDSRGRREVLVANIDVLTVVVSVPPKADWFVADRYLGAAELLGIDAAVVANKMDLEQTPKTLETLNVYEELGYPVIRCSSLRPETLTPIRELIGERTAVLVGLSGVGKSSIINRLLDKPRLTIGNISAKSGEGKHTTVVANMLPVQGGGDIIDSPGVRDYAPSIEDPADAAVAFREIAAAAAGCRYANCRHLREPGCAVKAGVESGAIDERRYASYKRLINLTEQLRPRQR
ncbi:MAG: ribosome small subunit-dependent GTPase A [Pseudomonadota bacterium]